jgi:hypothetical protein
MITGDLWIVISIAVSTILGWTLCVYLFPPSLSRRFAACFAPAIGLGICSLSYLPFRRPMFTVEAVFLIVAVLLLYRHHRRKEATAPLRPWRPDLWSLIFACMMGFALTTLTTRVDRMPHGNWDGWAIWNTHARVLVRNGPEWKEQLQYTVHGDYPQLTSASTARFWRYAGHEVPEAGAVMGILLGLSCVAVLAVGLFELRDLRTGLVMAMMLIGTPHYLDHMTSQYAEVPLSFFILMTLALITVQAERAPKNRSMLALAGLSAGCAGWTKNEGLLFIAAVCAALLLPVLLRRSRISERLAPFLAGLLVPLAVIVFFKMAVPVQNDLIQAQSYEAATARITDLGRYSFIFKYFLKTFWTFGMWSLTPLIPLFLFVAVRGIHRPGVHSSGWRVSCFVLVLVLAGYFAVFVNTPADLEGHLYSALSRLLLHLWPSFLFLVGLSVRSRKTDKVNEATWA